jgi:hypothetical protein
VLPYCPIECVLVQFNGHMNAQSEKDCLIQQGFMRFIPLTGLRIPGTKGIFDAMNQDPNMSSRDGRARESIG